MEIVILGWVFTGLLLLLCLASFAAGRGMIPPNHFFGIRIPPLRRSAAAWRAGHAAAVLPALVAFVLSLLCSILGTITPAASIGSITVFIAGRIASLPLGGVRDLDHQQALTQLLRIAEPIYEPHLIATPHAWVEHAEALSGLPVRFGSFGPTRESVRGRKHLP